MTGERGAAVLTGHSRLSAPEISAKILLKKKACCIKRLTKASPVFFALLFCIFGNRGGLPFDVARYLLGLYKQRKSKKKAISEIPGAIFRKRNPNTVLPRHRHRQKPENEGSSTQCRKLNGSERSVRRYFILGADFLSFTAGYFHFAGGGPLVAKGTTAAGFPEPISLRSILVLLSQLEGLPPIILTACCFVSNT